MSDTQDYPIVMIGGGGHASVLTEILLQQGRTVLAVISPEDVSQRSMFADIMHLKQDNDVLEFQIDQVRLVNGIGMMPKSNFRQRINEYYLSLGYQFETVIADSALVSPFSDIETGAQVLSMAIIQPGATIGSHSIINTNALIEHDSHIGSYNHIAPKACLCGQVNTGINVYIGAHATVIPNCNLNDNSIVAAGSVLTTSITGNNSTCYPARSIIKETK